MTQGSLPCLPSRKCSLSTGCCADETQIVNATSPYVNAEPCIDIAAEKLLGSMYALQKHRLLSLTNQSASGEQHENYNDGAMLALASVNSESNRRTAETVT